MIYGKHSIDIEVEIAVGEARHADKIARFQVDMAMGVGRACAGL